MKKANQLLIFSHIPKTGGSTLRSIITGQYAPEKILTMKRMSQEAFVSELENMSVTERDNIKVLQGHVFFGIHKEIKRRAKYITFLRDPIERHISHYYHAKRKKEESHHLEVNKEGMTLKEFTKSGKSKGSTDNAQTRWILNNKNTPHGKMREKHLDAAKKRIERQFIFVGILEQFDTSVFLLGDLLNWSKGLIYEIRLINPNRPAVEDLDKETLDIVKEYNEVDIQLYEWAQDRLMDMLEEKGECFKKQLEVFKQCQNAYLEKFNTWGNPDPITLTQALKNYASHLVSKVRS